jgi:hypothetical protein
MKNGGNVGGISPMQLYAPMNPGDYVSSIKELKDRKKY